MKDLSVPRDLSQPLEMFEQFLLPIQLSKLLAMSERPVAPRFRLARRGFTRGHSPRDASRMVKRAVEGRNKREGNSFGISLSFGAWWARGEPESCKGQDL